MSGTHTANGTKLYQGYENDRNMEAEGLIEDIVRTVFGSRKCIVGHHIVFVVHEAAKDPKTGLTHDYHITQELPCMDNLIFDHDIARRLWGERWQDYTIQLALEPVAGRDALLAKLFYRHHCTNKAA